ncbi:MAG: hypothetical protein QOC82_1952 [Frankiaceae bacterium]|nr:hypothetical protein [Frankiaceae bacterium]
MTEEVDEPRLGELLAAFERAWQRLGAPIATALRRGLADDAFTATGLPFEMPRELRIWWSWHDGADG